MLNSRKTILAFRKLFPNSIFLGFRKRTGSMMINVILGGKGKTKEGKCYSMKNHFFSRIKDHLNSPDNIAQIWLYTALDAHAKVNARGRYASVDLNGKRWIIRGGHILTDMTI